MPITDIVDIQTITAAAGPTQKGFGIPMILGYSQRFAERARRYSSSADMITDGFLATDAEYMAAVALESQNPKVEAWIVGRGNNKPTSSWRATIAQTLNSQVYSVKLNGKTASFTSDATATTDEIRTGLKAALDALAQPVTVTQPGAVTYLDVVGNVAGAFHAVESLDPTLITVAQTHADPGVAADLTAIALYDESWYGLITSGNSKALILAAAAWVEANKKFYVAATADTDTITTGVGSGDVADTVKATNYGRTAVIYHPDASEFVGAAWMGNRLPFTPGQETWKFARLAGVVAAKLTTAQIANLNAKNANYFYSVAGLSMTSEGKVGAGVFIDTVRGIDWQEARIAERTIGILVGATTKIPYTDKGAATIAASVLAALREGVDSGLLAEDPAPKVTVPKVATISPTDKGNRLLPAVAYSATLAGAIHKVQIRGQVAI